MLCDSSHRSKLTPWTLSLIMLEFVMRSTSNFCVQIWLKCLQEIDMDTVINLTDIIK